MELSLFCSHCHAYLGNELLECPECGEKREAYALPPRPGTPLWTAQLRGAGRGKPVVFRNLVIFPWGNHKDRGGVTAFDRFTGEEVWNYFSETTPEAAAVVREGAVFFTTLNYVTGAKVCCLDASNGKEIWQFFLPDSCWSSPVVQEGRVFAGAANGQIFGIASENGQLLQHYPIQFARGKMWLAKIDETQFAALSESGAVQLFTAMRSAGDWREPVKIRGRISSPAGVYQKHLYFGVATNESFQSPQASDGYLAEMDILHGNVQVFAENLKSISAAPIVHEGVLYVASRDHCLHAYDRSTRKELWMGKSEHSFTVAPEVYRGLVIAGSHDGSLYAFPTVPEVVSAGNKMNSPVWKFPVGDLARISTSAFCIEDVCYISSEDGTVLALPYHLGEYQWLARSSERNIPQVAGIPSLSSGIKEAYLAAANSYVLACCYVPPQQQEECMGRAANYWNLAGEPEWTARLLEGRRELREAAQAYENCAEFHRSANPRNAGILYHRAAWLYWRQREYDHFTSCQEKACFLGGWPLIHLEWVNESELRQHEEGEITLRVYNVGYSKLEGLKFKLRGSLLHYVEFIAPISLPAASSLDIPMKIVPVKTKSELNVEVEYWVPGVSQPFTNQLSKVIQAAPPNPKVKLGDVVKGNVRVYAPNNQSVDLEMGDNILSTVEIVMGEAPGAQAGNGSVECPRCHYLNDAGANFCNQCQETLEY